MNAIRDARFATIKFFLLIFCLFLITACAGTQDKSKGGDTGSTALSEEQKNKEKNHLLQIAEKTLQELYKKKPAAKKLIEKSYGYAVFSNTDGLVKS